MESDGNLGVKEVRSLLRKCLKEETIPDNIIYEFIQTYDQDRDVQLSYKEFLRIVTWIILYIKKYKNIYIYLFFIIYI